MPRFHSLLRLWAVVVLFPLLASSSIARAEPERAWILTDRRLVVVDLDSGESLEAIPIAAGEDLLETGESSPPLVRLATEEILGIDLAAGRTAPLSRGLDPVRLAVTTPSGALYLASETAIERQGANGSRRVESMLPARAGLLVSDGRRLWGFADSIAFRIGGTGPFDDSAFANSRAPMAGCFDPLEERLLILDGELLRTFEADGRPVASTPSAATTIVCGSFGRAWTAGPGELRKWRTAGDSIDLELDPTSRATVRAASRIAADPRDFGVLVATDDRLVALDADGDDRWEWRGEPGELVLDVSTTSERGGPRARHSPPKRQHERTTLQSAPIEPLGGTPLIVTGDIFLSERFPSEEPVEGVDVIAFGDDVTHVTTGTDGGFSLQAARRASSPVLDVEARTLAGSNLLETDPRSISVPPETTSVDLGALWMTHACEVGFSSGLFPSGALNGEVRAMVVFDDGSGPALYVAGTFTTAGGVAANRVARWNGASWSALGSGLGGGTSPSVDALAVFDDGSGAKLYAGGKFTTSGATSVKYVGRWNGTGWSQVGAGLGNQVLALAVYDSGSGPSLYAGGSFTTVGSTNFNRLARWNGTSWATVGGGANNIVRALTSFDDGAGARLVVGGSFTQVGGSVSASRIAGWNGSTWTALGSGVSGGTTIQVNALVTDETAATPLLYVGGRFTNAGGNAANHVAAWDGAVWFPLDSGLNVLVNALGLFDDGAGPRLYAAGSFTTAAGQTLNRLARWTGSYWHPLGTGLNGAAKALAGGTIAGEPAFFVGGAFTTANGIASSRLARIERPPTCTDLEGPRLYWVDPLDGETVGTGTPLLRVGFIDPGSAGVDLSSLTIARSGIPLSLSCTHFDSYADCTPTTSLGSGVVTLDATLGDLAGNLSAVATVAFSISETTPPSLAIVEPAAGTSVPTARPPIRFSYSDEGAGVDTSSLLVTFNGQALGLECQLGANAGVCVPATDLSEGPVVVEATIADLQQNVSDPASVSFEVAIGAPLATDLEGVARFEDGEPAAGARVWLTDEPALWVTAGVDGRFVLADIDVAAGQSLAISARWDAPQGADYLGFLSGISAVAGGVTNAGDVILKRSCEGYFTALPFVAVNRVLAGTVFDLEVWDGGGGPRVFAGGDFNYGNGGTLGRVAQWTPRGWGELAGGVRDSYQPDVRALAVFDSGAGPELVAGGSFTYAGGAPASNLAFWDGSEWRELGRGVNDRVTGLAVFDDGSGPALYVAGDFTEVQTRPRWPLLDVTIPANHVAKWDGETWSEVGGGLELSGFNMEFRLDVLTDTSGTHLYAWEKDGLEIWKLVDGVWTGIGPSDFVLKDLVAADVGGSGPRLYASLTAIGVVTWTGSSWLPILDGDWEPFDLAAVTEGGTTYLYASGAFWLLPGGGPNEELRRWNGSAWSAPLGEPGELFALGGFGPEPLLVRANPLSTWTGGWWEPFAADLADTDGTVTSVALLGDDDPPSLLFSGLDRAGGVELAGHVGRWDGSQVTLATAGLPGASKVRQAFDGQRVRTYGIDVEVGQIAEWNGSEWTLLGPAIGVPIQDVDWIDLGNGPRLYAAGSGVFRWNGAFWHEIGGPNGTQTIEGFQGQLYAGGSSNLQRWNGTSWTAMGPTWVNALESFGNVLQVAGGFASAGGQTRWGFAGWNGSAWVNGEGPNCGFLANRFLSALQAQTRIRSTLWALETFDDGSGAELLIGGDYAARYTTCSGSTHTGSVLPYVNVNLSSGVDGPPVTALAAGRWSGAPAVVLGGAFGEASGAPAARLAIWHPAPSWEGCSEAGKAPTITLSAPPSPWTNQASTALTGRVDEPATLALDGAPVALAADWTFSVPVTLSEGVNGFYFEAVDRNDQVGGLRVEIVRDSAPPALAITSPAPGSVLFTEPFAIDFAYGDAASGVDLASLEVLVAGSPVPLSSCAVRETQARCTASGSPGPLTISATVRDRAGNLSMPASAAVTLETTGGASTTLVGLVRTEDGAPGPNARIRVLGLPGVEGLSQADGSFSLPVANVASSAPWTVVAESIQGGTPLVGLRSGLVPLAGGSTNAGILVLRAACDLEAVPGLFGKVGLDGRASALALYDDGSGPALYVGGDSILASPSQPVSHLVRWTGARFESVPGGPNGPVYALAAYDDGSGSKLYAGGTFVTAGALAVSGIARWDGAGWEDVGGGVKASLDVYPVGCREMSGTVFALRVFDAGSGPELYVGGNFSTVGAALASDLVARWGPSGWTSTGARVGAGCPGWPVFALAAFDDGTGPAIYAGGYFPTIAGVPLDSVAKLGPGGWQSLEWGLGQVPASGSPDMAKVLALETFDSGEGPELVAGGLFNRAGDRTQPTLGVARWNGVRWAPLGEGLDFVYSAGYLRAGIQALAVFDDGEGPALYAAGSFSGETEARFGSIARWNGFAWSPVGEGISEAWYEGMAMLALGGELVVAGDFATAGGLGTKGIARWDGEVWHPYGLGLDGPVRALAVYDDGTGPAIFAGGDFVSFGELRLDHVGRWDGDSWSPVRGGVDGPVHAFEAFDDGRGSGLYAGGRFSTAGGVAAESIARWDGASWSPLGAGLYDPGTYGNDAVVYALEVHDDGAGPALFVAGDFDEAGAVARPGVASWRGGAWNGLSSGIAGPVYALREATVGGSTALFVGGSFSAAGGVAAQNVARWNGAAFAPLASGRPSPVRALEAWPGDRLIAGGDGSPSLSIWNGSAWASPTGGSPSASTYALTQWTGVLDDGLYAGGSFSSSPASSPRLQRWNGSGWSAVGTGLGDGSALALHPFTDLAGPALYVGGSFGTADGVMSEHLSAWRRPLTCGDTAPPSVSVSAPSPGFVPTRRPLLGATYADAQSAVDTTTLAWRRDGQLLNAACSAGPTEATCSLVEDLPEGPSTLTVEVADFAANLGTSQPVAILVDATPPLVSFIAPEAGAILLANDPVVTVQFSDAGSGIDPATFSLAGNGPGGSFSCSNDEESATCSTVTPLGDGAWSLVAEVSDLAGVAGEAERSFLVDTQDPVLALTSPQPGAVINDATPEILFTFGDFGAGIDTSSFAAVADSGSPALACSVSAGAATCVPTSSLSEGAHAISASIRDLAGRQTSVGPSPFTVQLDFTPPVLVVTQPPVDGFTTLSAIVVQGTVSEPAEVIVNGIGAAVAPDLSFASDPVALLEGPNSLLVQATDAVGNSAAVSRTLTRDTIAPLLSFTSPTGGSIFDTTASPVVLAVVEATAGVDPGSLTFTANGQPVAATCSFTPSTIQCELAVLPAGSTTLEASGADRAGNPSVPASVAFTNAPGVDLTAPRITVESPYDGAVVQESAQLIRGVVSEPCNLTLDGSPLAVEASLEFTTAIALAEGVNSFAFVAVDAAGNTGTLAYELTLDSSAPAGLVANLVTVVEIVPGLHRIAGEPGSVPEPAGTSVIARFPVYSATIQIPVLPDGSFSREVAGIPGDRTLLAVRDTAGNESESLERMLTGTMPSIPDPESVAPAQDASVATEPCRAAEFLWSGSNALQFGTQPGAIDCDRATLIRGRVIDAEGGGLAGVVVRVDEQPEAGRTLTRADGSFDLAANGGRLTLGFAKAGFLPAERVVLAGWRAWTTLEPVGLVPSPATATPVDLPSISSYVAARGEVESDSLGSRAATLVLGSGLAATLVMANGDSQPVTSLDVRLREYTADADFERFLPAEAPSEVSPAYAVELSVDAVAATGASRIAFSRALPFYVENLLGVPVGTDVPAGFLDRERHAWVPAPNGRVVEVLGEAEGEASLDVDGSGQPADGAALASLGIDSAELAALADLYEPGQELWRVPVQHFTPWMIGWPYLRRLAEFPPLRLPRVGDEDELDRPAVSRFGGTIEVENQVLRTSLDLVGTAQALHYRSDRVPGRKAPFLLTIPLSGDTVPADLLRIDVAIDIAGQHVEQSYAPTPSQEIAFSWNGLDRFGRPVAGRQDWSAAVRYVCEGNLAIPDSGNPAFGLAGGLRIASSPTRHEVSYSREHSGTMGTIQAAAATGLGGWTLSAHHVLDLEAGVLHYGDGRRRQLGAGGQEPLVAKRVVGTGVAGLSGDEGPAEEAQLDTPTGLSIASDGSLLVVDAGNCRVRRVNPDGVISTLAGSSCPGVLGPVGDGGPATAARLAFPQKAIEGPDGMIYIADTGHFRVRRIRPDGTIETVVGTGEEGCPEEQTVAANEPMQFPQDIAFDLAGNLLVLSRDFYGVVECRGLRRVDGEGRVSLVAGWGTQECEECSGSYIPVIPRGVAVAQDGSIYLADMNRIDRRPAEGRNPGLDRWNVGGVNRLYGPSDDVFFAGDGLPASFETTRFYAPSQVAVGPDHTVYVADTLNARVRKIGGDRIVNTVFGGGTRFLGDGELPATDVVLGQVEGVAVDPAGRFLFASDILTHSVYRVGLPEIQGDAEKIVASEDGTLLYIFDRDGRHLRTEDALDRQVLLEFRYAEYTHPDGGTTKLLTEIEDSFGNVTRIERDEEGVPEGIVGPFGQTTTLTLHPTTGHLWKVSRPLASGVEEVEIATTNDGLIQSLKDPENGTYGYTWDPEGRLTRVEDPENGWLELDLQQTVSGHAVTQTSKGGRTSSTEVSFLPNEEIAQVLTLPTGLEIEALRRKDGTVEWTYPDDTRMVVETEPEPRLGSQAKLTTRSELETPDAGLLYEVTRDRAVSTVPGVPGSVALQTDTATLNGRTSTTSYSGATRTLTRTSPEGRTSTSVFDAFGRISEAREPGIDPVLYTYDAQGRLQQARQGVGGLLRLVSYGYDASGFLETVTDPLDEVTRFERDAVGRVTKVIRPDLREVRFEYDLNGNLVSLTPPSRPDHLFDHNGVDQPVAYSPPDLDPGTPEVPSTTFGYNDDHQLTTITRPDGQVISIAYEPSGRLDSVTAPHGTVDYTFDATSGKLSSITAPGGATIAYAYDGPWVEELSVGGPFAATVQLEADRPFPGQLDTNFWLEKLRINDLPATEIVYENDDDGLPTKIGELELYWGSQAARLIGTELFSTGDRVTRNSFGETETYRAGFCQTECGGQPPLVGTPLLDVTYQRDDLGRITRKTETTRASLASSPVTRVWDYAYDPETGRLEGVELDDVVVETYGYDDNGNRTSFSTSFGSGSATYDDQDRLLTYGSASYTYTDNGELLTKTVGSQTTSYGYDVFGNLRTVTLPDGIDIEYLIDGRNRRIGKKIEGVLVQRFLYLGGLSPIAELDASGNVTTQYLYSTSGNVPDAFLRGGVTYRVFTDHLGSVRLVVDAETGEVAQRIEYDSFGRVTLDSNPGFQPFGFAGGLYDHQTGIVRFGARDYDPEAGRWTTKDPIGFGGGDAGLYIYVGNDPVNRTDPAGLWAFPWEALDLLSYQQSSAQFSRSVSAFANSPSWRVAVQVGSDLLVSMADAAALLLPVVPATGGLTQLGVRHVPEVIDGLFDSSSAVANGIRGRESEARVLADLGLEKNTKKVFTAEGSSVPDALDDAVSLEVKDAVSVARTRQVRIQTEAAAAAGRQSVLVTGVNTCVTGPCLDAYDLVIRRTDLGPP